MESDEWDALFALAEHVAESVGSRAGARLGARVVWFHVGAESATARPYRLDLAGRTIGLNRDLVATWVDRLPREQSVERFTGLAYRAIAGLLYAPPASEWTEAADLHIRSEQDQGLGEEYATAFRAANQILEDHRLDQRLLEVIPGAGEALSELVRFDLDGYPTFDTYPRAAVVMGRPDLPENLVQPAFDEFVESFGVEEADELLGIVSSYVALDAADVDGMVELTAKLVFQAFPEAMGLGRFDDDELTSDDLWEFQRRLSADGSTGWDELEQFVATALARFTGEAGLDFGDALLIGLGDNPVAGPRIGTWAHAGSISADIVGIPFQAGALQLLHARGWESLGSAPESLQKVVPVSEAGEFARDVVWILNHLAAVPATAGLMLLGRGPVVDAAVDLGWSRGGLESGKASHEPRIASPETPEELVELVRDSLRDLTGVEPAEYATGRFSFEVEDLEIAVLAPEETFPAIRFDHRVMAVPQELRSECIEFANALHGRTSTMGAHWWVGDGFLWQQSVLWASKFDEEILIDHLSTFINIARDRTPEIRSRLGGT